MSFSDSISFLVGLAAQEGVLLVIVIGGGSWGLWFLSARLWPWYSNVHRPAVHKLREQEFIADAAMSSALAATSAATVALTVVLDHALTKYDMSDALADLVGGRKDDEPLVASDFPVK